MFTQPDQQLAQFIQGRTRTGLAMPAFCGHFPQLRQARLDAGLTPIDVAQLLGKHQSYVSKCETGERRVDFVELLDFSAIYKKPTEYFLP